MAVGLGVAITATAWKLGWTAKPDPGLLVGSLAILLIAGDLVFSKKKREEFKRTYQQIDRKYNPLSREVKNPWIVVAMAGVGVVGSLALGMPKALTIALLCSLGLLILNALIQR